MRGAVRERVMDAAGGTAARPNCPLVSIVINNRNYAAFVAAAIESALDQTYAHREVIVVDDGSTDHSREIISGYGDRVVASNLAHGGQAAACNAGFARCHGEIVLFLDADDLLLPDAIERVVEAFAVCPDAARVHFRLEVVDHDGIPTGRFIPRSAAPLPQGDLRRAVLDHGDDLAWVSMSGNAFATWALRRVMPIPTAAFPRVGADIYLANCTTLFGPVVALPGVGGRYRVHGANAYHRTGLDLARSRLTIRLSDETHGQLAGLAGEAGVPLPEGRAVGARSLTLLGHRLAVARLDATACSPARENAWRLVMAGLATACRRRDRPLHLRLAYAAWFVSVALAPRPLSRRLAQRLLSD